MTESMLPLAEIANVGKAFGGVPAVRDVSFELFGGEVVGLIGANGAGKSTLMKILAGIQTPDVGEIRIRGKIERFRDPRAALQRAGIVLVPQEIQLVHGESVADNVLLSTLPSRWGIVRGRATVERASSLLDRVGMGSVSPRTSVDLLTPVQQRLLTIAMALSEEPRLLILDEPSAALPLDTTELLWPIIEGLREEGASVIYVSHRLSEIERISDRVMAMRDGQIVTILGRSGRTADQLVELVGGKSRKDEPPPVAAAHVGGSVVVEAEDLSGQRVEHLNFVVHAGEILGVGGLQGAGRSELLRLISGVQKPSGGAARVNGKQIISPVAAARNGVGYLSEGRSRMIFPGMDVAANTSIVALRNLTRALMVNRRRERESVVAVADRIHIKGALGADITTLSGGNQQKSMLGRWLLNESRLFVLDEPTMGIDVGTRAEIHRLLRSLASEGATVIVASAEPEELQLLCDRVIILIEGKLANELRAPFGAQEVVAASFARERTSTSGGGPECG